MLRPDFKGMTSVVPDFQKLTFNGNPMRAPRPPHEAASVVISGLPRTYINRQGDIISLNRTRQSAMAERTADVQAHWTRYNFFDPVRRARFFPSWRKTFSVLRSRWVTAQPSIRRSAH